MLNIRIEANLVGLYSLQSNLNKRSIHWFCTEVWVEESEFGYMVWTKVYVYRYDDVLVSCVDFSPSLMRDYCAVAMVLAAEIMMGVLEREDEDDEYR